MGLSLRFLWPLGHVYKQWSSNGINTTYNYCHLSFSLTFHSRHVISMHTLLTMGKGKRQGGLKLHPVSVDPCYLHFSAHKEDSLFFPSTADDETIDCVCFRAHRGCANRFHGRHGCSFFSAMTTAVNTGFGPAEPPKRPWTSLHQFLHRRKHRINFCWK